MSDFEERHPSGNAGAAIRSVGRWGTERGRPPCVALAVGTRAGRLASLCPGVPGGPVLESGIGPDGPIGTGPHPTAGRRTAGLAGWPAATPVRAWGGGKVGGSMSATTLTIAASFLIALVVGMGLTGNGSGGLSRLPVKAVKEDYPLANTATCVAARRRWNCPGERLGDGHAGTASCRDGRPETFRISALHRDTLDQDMLEECSDASFRPSCSRPSSSRAITSCSSVRSFPFR